MMQYITSFVLFFSSLLSLHGQVSPKDFLVDEFGPLPSGDLLARTDYLLSRLSEDPSSRAIVIITPRREKLVTRPLGIV